MNVPILTCYCILVLKSQNLKNLQQEALIVSRRSNALDKGKSSGAVGQAGPSPRSAGPSGGAPDVDIRKLTVS